MKLAVIFLVMASILSYLTTSTSAFSHGRTKKYSLKICDILFFSFKILARYPSSFRPFRRYGHRGNFDQGDFGNRRSKYYGNGVGRRRFGFPSERRHFRKNYAFTDPHTLHTITRIGCRMVDL